MKFTAQLQWIKKEFGGREHIPVVGLRPVLRIQRKVNSWLEGANGVSIQSLCFDPQTWSSEVVMKMIPNVIPPEEGELIELLDGYRVIAVGKVVNTLDS